MSNTTLSDLSLDFASLVDIYAGTGMTAMFWYEHIITLGREINLFWNEKITGATVLFFVNRYSTLFYQTYVFPGWPLSMKYEICVVEYYISAIADYLQYIPWGVFSALRVYALSGRKLTMALVVLLLSSVTSITAVIYIPFWKFYPDPDVGCDFTYSLSLEAQEIMVVASRASLIVADVLVLIITWRSTHKNFRTQGFAGVLLRDGLLYFFAQLLLNIFYFIALFNIGDAFNALGVNTLAGTFTVPLTSTLISRFLMDLQETGLHTQHRHGLSSMSSIHMSRVLGSIGVELNAPGPVEDIQSEGRVQADSAEEPASV